MSVMDEAIQAITPEIYYNLKRAVELGKWPDGREVSREQRAHCMQAVIAYEARNQMPEAERTGYIDRGSKADGALCDDEPDVVRIVRDRGGV